VKKKIKKNKDKQKAGKKRGKGGREWSEKIANMRTRTKSTNK
jgi:hypothetical protein